MPKMKTSDIIRLALHYAILDRQGYADCWSTDDNGNLEGPGLEAYALAEEMKAYLMKRFKQKPMYQIDLLKYKISGA